MKSSKGFTLIELIVVMAVFMFVIGAAIAIFISIVQNQRRILAEQEFLNQASYVQEVMSKALRVAIKDDTGDCLGDTSYAGYSYLLTRPDGNGAYTGIKFLNESDLDPAQKPACTEFFMSNGILKELKTYPPYNKTPSGTTILDSQAADISSSAFKILKIRFGVDGYDGTNLGPVGDQDPDPKFSDILTVQPKITIVMEVQDGVPQPQTIQTTVSQRNLNAQ